MITLNGYTYYIKADAHKPSYEKQGETRLTITERVDRTDSTKTLNKWSYTILCPYTNVNTMGGLNTIIAARKQGGLLDFIDEENVHYVVSSGTDTDSHKYSTGVYFENMGSPSNLGPVLSSTSYTVEIQLVCGKAL
jgi:hypothetical protein